jgi:phospholipid/cholesterol/gamma-HCH transport system ATP-binding protein
MPFPPEIILDMAEKMDLNEKKGHITVRDLTLAYGDFVLMRDVNFTVNRGDIFIIMGGSGCGKSTLMTTMIGLKPPARGQVLYDYHDFCGSDQSARDHILRRAGVM